MIRLEDVIQLKDDERVRAFTRRHGITIVPNLLLALVLIVVPFFFLFPLFSSGPTGVVAFIAMVVAGAVIAFRSFIMWDGDIIVVTNKRLVDVDQLGVFSRTVNEIVVENIQDCSWSKNNLLDQILNMGHFKARSASGSLTIEAKCIPRPQELQHLVNEIREEATLSQSGRSAPRPQAAEEDDEDEKEEEMSPEKEKLIDRISDQLEGMDEAELRNLAQTLKDEDRDITIKRLFSEDGEEPKELKEVSDS
jgi:uncharacterized membrane protein YdbT with pleckstrin-like domain